MRSCDRLPTQSFAAINPRLKLANRPGLVTTRPYPQKTMNTTHKSSDRVATVSSARKTHVSKSGRTSARTVPNSEGLKQDRVTLIAFYALFAAIAAGVLYFLSLIFFI